MIQGAVFSISLLCFFDSYPAVLTSKKVRQAQAAEECQGGKDDFSCLRLFGLHKSESASLVKSSTG